MPRRVLLIDVDSKIPNLALMKLSTFYKSMGCEVGFNVLDPDIIYASIIFEKNKHKADGLKFLYPDAKIIIGGSGYDYSVILPDEIESLKPDYSLYNGDYSIGFSTRGCIRACSFCIVPQKEGKFKIVQHPEEWHNPEFKKIVFLDNNILADKKWFLEVADWCISLDLSVWFSSGFDIRLLDPETAAKLLEMKFFKGVFFAWDHVEDEAIIKAKIQLLKEVGFTDSKLKRFVQFYVYVDSDSDYNNAVYRCRELKKLSCNAFVMFNIKNKPTKRIRQLQRWANRKQLFWSKDISEYVRSKKDRREFEAVKSRIGAGVI
jgi:hypothetical protein